ncbi:MAG: SRPBCC family protein [Actinomycetota bacterium]|nr:SRPBCC family protein [Actinomycetota bacterium]
MTFKTVAECTTVDAPPEVVFSIIADPRQHSRIDGSGSVRDTIDGPPRLSKGATFGVSMKLFGLPYRISNRVVEFEENRLIAWRHFGGHRWRYELEPVAGGTLVTETFDYSRYGTTARAVIEGARFPARNRAGIVATLVRLKAAAEADVRG